MKKTVKIILLLAIAVLAAGSCKKEIFSKKGEKISFGAGTSAGTKTVYGAVEAGEQIINWVVDDQIKIAGKNCPIETDRQTDTVALYKVTETNPDGKGENYGKIDVVGPGLGLVWGENVTHNFYAVYPGSADINTFGTIKGNIPVQQDGSHIEGRDNASIVVKPDMTNLYMVAKVLDVKPGSKIIQSTGEELFLEFQPLSTAIEFTIECGFEDKSDSMVVKSVALERASYSSSATNVLSGDFTVHMNESGLYYRPKTEFSGDYSEDSKGRVEINFDEPIVVKNTKSPNKQSLTFTFFLNPGNRQDVSDLYFIITYMDNNDASKTNTFTLKARLKNGDSYVSFKTHKKTTVKGMVVPEAFIISIDERVFVSEWENVIDGEGGEGKEYFGVEFI